MIGQELGAMRNGADATLENMRTRRSYWNSRRNRIMHADQFGKTCDLLLKVMARLKPGHREKYIPSPSISQNEVPRPVTSATPGSLKNVNLCPTQESESLRLRSSTQFNKPYI